MSDYEEGGQGRLAQVELTLSCDNPAAELLIVNATFQKVANGSSPLIASIAPGIYALTSKIGSRIEERLVAIDGSEAKVPFVLPAPAFDSPMPLAGTATDREYHETSLGQFTGAGTAKHEIGQGSALVFYVRDTSRRNFSVTPEHLADYEQSFRGFMLLDLNGAPLVDFDAVADRHIHDGYIGAHVRLDPDHYVLCWRDEGCTMGLPVHAIPGWTLQVFVRLQPESGHAVRMRPDFSEVAFAFERPDVTYSSHRDDYRLMEAARLALLEQRDVGKATLHAIASSKFDNPMLGIYGAHLCAARGEKDWDLFDQVLSNTAGLLGTDQPDLVALAWLYESARGRPPSGFATMSWSERLAALPGPPLLVRSWEALIDCAQSNAVDIEDLAGFRVAGRLALRGIVLSWEESAPIVVPEIRAQTPPDVLSDMDESLAGTLAWQEPTYMPWSGVAGSLLRTLRRRGGREFFKSTLRFTSSYIRESRVLGEDAPELMQRLAASVQWHDLIHAASMEADPGGRRIATAFSPLQRELMSVLARGSAYPQTLEGINSAYIEGVARAHRVPVSTVIGALHDLETLIHQLHQQYSGSRVGSIAYRPGQNDPGTETEA